MMKKILKIALISYLVYDVAVSIINYSNKKKYETIASNLNELDPPEDTGDPNTVAPNKYSSVYITPKGLPSLRITESIIGLFVLIGSEIKIPNVEVKKETENK